MTFEDGLKENVDPNTPFGRRVKKILALPKSDKRRGRVLARMEKHTRVHLGLTGPVNWNAASIDWQTIIDLLIKLLPLIIALFGL